MSLIHRLQGTVTENASFTFFRPRRKWHLWTWCRALSANAAAYRRIRCAVPTRTADGRYHISLCLMFKDEAPYLREWIEYHRMVGVDHFYLYDNNSSDGFESVIAPYLESGVATLIRWPKDHAQVEGYEDCIRRFQEENDWIGFIDIDEFVVPVAEESLVTFLDHFAGCPAVLIYWRFFGSGGMLERDVSRLVTEDFTVASEKLYNKGKCFFNCHFDYLFDSPLNKSMFHYLWTVSDGRPLPPVNMFGRTTVEHWHPATRKKIPVQLNHYAVKSLAEHRQKDLKGDVYYDHPTHDDRVFFGRDRRCSVPDFRIQRYVAELKLRLRQLPDTR